MATLSDDPTGLELEDFVAAHLAARGRFVETGVTERAPVDILELDVVWTDYDDPKAPRHPVEVKSGDWGLGDLFKFYGWSHYLKLGPGWFFCRRLPSRIDDTSLQRLCDRLGISLCHVENLEFAPELFTGLGLPDPAFDWLPELWRYSYWAQRRLLKSLGCAIDAGVCPNVARQARDYQKLINDGVFFEHDVRARVASLMEAHWKHPRLALSAAAEIDGQGVNLDDPPQTAAFRKALYEGKYFPVQACLYLEHRARLGILKAAVDYLIALRAGKLPRRVIWIFGDSDRAERQLYQRFLEVVNHLEAHDGFRRYPVFWQTFLWTWGGFILNDRKDAEYQRLSSETGVPQEQVEDALALWDDLFPIERGWFISASSGSCHQLKLMPPAMRGLGAYRRLLLYGVEKYEDLSLPDDTPRRMAVDHNTLVRLLDGNDSDLVQ